MSDDPVIVVRESDPVIIETPGAVLVVTEPALVIETEAAPQIFTEAEPVVIVSERGPRGEQGLQGIQGLPGPAGSVDAVAYEHHQGVPAEVWTITHPLPYTPNISVVDSSGRQTEGEILVLSSTQVQVRFERPFGGIAYLT